MAGHTIQPVTDGILEEGEVGKEGGAGAALITGRNTEVSWVPENR